MTSYAGSYSFQSERKTFRQGYQEWSQHSQITQVYRIVFAMTACSVATCWAIVHGFLPSAQGYAFFALFGALGAFDFFSRDNPHNSMRKYCAFAIALSEGALLEASLEYIRMSTLMRSAYITLGMFAALCIWSPIFKQRHIALGLSITSSILLAYLMQSIFHTQIVPVSNMQILIVMLISSGLMIVETVAAASRAAYYGSIDILGTAVRLHLLLWKIFRIVIELTTEHESNQESRRRERRQNRYLFD